MMAVAALAACTKSEVQYEPAGEIGFAPVASNVTKSVAGYDGETFNGVFPTDIDLYVFANAVQGTYDANNVGEAYFKNAQFKYDEDNGTESTQGDVATAGAYAGNPTRYWPNVKSLVFAGYSDACNVTQLTTKPSMDFKSNTLTIEGYTQDNSKTAGGANDLMWFACDGVAYSKQDNEVAAKMQHACSWITIKVYGDDVTATYTADDSQHTGWTLNKLEVTSLVHTASVKCAVASASWSYPDNATKTSEVYYETSNGTTFTRTADEYATSAKDQSVANNFIVIPQIPTNLDVTYTYTSDADNNLTLTETKSVSLKYTAADVENTSWQSGVHYIYNVKITATEILIDPYVVEWTGYTGNELASTI